MLRPIVLLILCLTFSATPALAQGFGESPLITIFAIVAAIAIVIFIAVSEQWALWCGVIVWGIGLVVNAPVLPMYLIGSAFVLPGAFLLRKLITSRNSKEARRPKKPLRKKRNGRRFRLSFQIGYDSPPSDVKASPEPEEPRVPEEPTSPEIPTDTEGYSKSYGEITSYEQWLEREREEQKRITRSRSKSDNNNSVMKKSIVVAVVGVVTLAALTYATGFGPDVVKIKSDPPQRVDAAFRLFETQNVWNFLLLDTRYGRVWQVQFSIDENAESFMIELPLTHASRGRRESSAIAPPAFPNPKRSTIVPSPGTFTLYPTQNRWNFLLLNQETGEMWQCQYSLGAGTRFKRPIPVSQ